MIAPPPEGALTTPIINNNEFSTERGRIAWLKQMKLTKKDAIIKEITIMYLKKRLLVQRHSVTARLRITFDTLGLLEF